MSVESITGEYDNFSIPLTHISDEILYEVADRNGLKPESLPPQTRVQYEELEEAMESIDGRSDHERAQDAALQFFVDRYDKRSYDLILTDVDYDLSGEIGAVTDGEWKGIRGRKYQGEIDIMLVNLDDEWVQGVEVKPHRGKILGPEGEPVHEDVTHEKRARRQVKNKAFAFEFLDRNEEGFNWDYFSSDPIYESELLPKTKIPDSFSGRYYWDKEAERKGFESEEFHKLLRSFVLEENPHAFAPENSMEREEIEIGDFIVEYLEN